MIGKLFNITLIITNDSTQKENAHIRMAAERDRVHIRPRDGDVLMISDNVFSSTHVELSVLYFFEMILGLYMQSPLMPQPGSFSLAASPLTRQEGETNLFIPHPAILHAIRAVSAYETRMATAA